MKRKKRPFVRFTGTNGAQAQQDWEDRRDREREEAGLVTFPKKEAPTSAVPAPGPLAKAATQGRLF